MKTLAQGFNTVTQDLNPGPLLKLIVRSSTPEPLQSTYYYNYYYASAIGTLPAPATPRLPPLPPWGAYLDAEAVEALHEEGL